MFDEKSPKWIKIYTGFTKVMFWLYIVAGAFMCFAGWVGELDLIDEGFIDGLVAMICFGLVAFVHLTVNMLIIQFLNNVQLIREKLEVR